MAGPAIRAWEMAKALSREHNVTLSSYSVSNISHDRVRLALHRNDQEGILGLAREHDAVILQPYVLSAFPAIAEVGRPLIMDMYDPYILELFEVHKTDPIPERTKHHVDSLNILINEIMAGDYFICASPRQKDFWAGMMAALGRINPRTYDRNPSLDGFLDIVPFGIDQEPPAHPGGKVLKGVVPGINADDKVLIWGGGIWNWFDTKTLVKAMALVAKTRPDIKLFFLGMVHPNPAMPDFQMKNARETLALAEELGLVGVNVFFNRDWVSYRDRGAYFLEADAGVTTHYDHLETTFSFRTRVLDYLWAGLPVITTKGDYMAELAESEGFGVSVPYEDPEALKDGIISLLEDNAKMKECGRNSRRIAEGFHWDKACLPLMKFLEAPSFAPDKLFRSQGLRFSVAKAFLLGRMLITYVKRDGLERTLLRIKHYIVKEREKGN